MADKEEKREQKKLKSYSDRFLHDPLKFFRSFLFPPRFRSEKLPILYGNGLSHLSSSLFY
jgi:hypothetical protein